MKKILFLLVLFSNMAFSQTNVPGGNVYGIWGISGSPYNINGHITIPVDSTLSIEPGVNIIFQGHYKLNVQGRILALGTISDTIVFTAENTTTGWWGIRFYNTPFTQDSSIFKYCKVQWGNANGVDDNGGAFFLYDFSKVHISNSCITNNAAYTSGGGIYCEGSSPTITSNTIINNSAISSGGGICCLDGIPTITNNTIIYNSTSNSGGGIYCGESSPVIANNIISNNSRSGIFCSGGSPTINGNTISYNTGTSFGGGIYCSYSSAAITNNNINNNTTSGSGSSGGGIYCIEGEPTIMGNTICNNTTSGGGGGIYCFGSTLITITGNTISNNNASYSGGGIFCEGSPKIMGNTINNNTSNGYGGGIYYGGVSSPTITGNTISNNNASYSGGGICCFEGTPSMIVNTISNNNASNSGGGIYCGGPSTTPNIRNCTIVNNMANNGGGLFCTNTSNPVLINVIIHGNIAISGNGNSVYLEDNASDPTFRYCNVQGGSAGFYLNGNQYTGAYTNNLNSDPLFTSPSGGAGTSYNGLTANWSLQTNSPCIDTGTPDTTGLNLPATDIAGNLRLTGCWIDIGAYEFYQAGVTFMADVVQSLFIACYGDSTATLTASATGGITPYEFLWSNSVTSSTNVNISAGNYSVTVSDAVGCSRVMEYQIDQPPEINIVTSNTNVDCLGNCTGIASASASGGTPTYTYLWNTTPNQTTSSINNLCTGEYIVTVTDNNSCTSCDTVLIATNTLLAFTTAQNNINCFGNNNGSITVTASGGAGSYQYSKDGGITFQTTNIFTGLAPGVYNILVHDGNGCQTSSVPVTITEPPILETLTSQENVDCYGNDNGSATIIASGGTGTYVYAWNTSPIQNTATIENLTAGEYIVTVTDGNNCYKTDTVSIVSSLPYFSICLVTVDTLTWKNKIMWEPELGLNLIGFNVYKEVSTNIYSGIGFVPYGDTCILIDYSSNPAAHGDKYKISALDSCSTESPKSPYHKTMNLVISAFGSTMGLSWTPYEDESGVFVPSKYYIYRGYQPDYLSLLDSVTGSFTSYNDINVFDVFYYIVGVKKDVPCNVLGTANSFSNIKDNSTLVGVSEQDEVCNFTIFPNPANDMLYFKSETATPYTVSIYDITGKLILQQTSPETIDVSKWDNGVYCYKITTQDNSITGRVVISR